MWKVHVKSNDSYRHCEGFDLSGFMEDYGIIRKNLVRRLLSTSPAQSRDDIASLERCFQDSEKIDLNHWNLFQVHDHKLCRKRKYC